MPVHDWTLVSAGTFHDFHCGWVVEIRNALNNGILPADFYAQAEQIAGDMGPDVLTLQTSGPPEEPIPEGSTGGTAEMDQYALKRRTVVVRHSSEDQIVALIEILSPGNKGSRHAFRAVVDKAVHALGRRLHLMLLDLFPPGPRDPQGIHGAVWAEISEEPFVLPPDKPLTLAAYAAGPSKKAYVNTVAVADVLPDMPLFLDPNTYVNVPLEATYRAAWEAVPLRWRRVLEP